MQNDLVLTPLAVTCTTGTCPTVYTTNRSSVIVQGYTVTAAAAAVDVPEGEQLVEIPLELLADAVRAQQKV
ncbi:hypothetical protein [Actinoplanes sp. DH11]|uniref:hypothetical protein n=1 Tax=Actinoplanes sp. DH11 TaxID=2857011 RepID=UPI001E2E17DD|nr:hypothetical protein [Actinoplanes sp. DH11]